MPIYEFTCGKCKKRYSELSKYDSTGEYADVECPKCGSMKKTKEFSIPVVCGTSSRMERFDYRAGRNLDRAQDERRFAETLSHMGTDPYSTGEFGKVPDDLGTLDEGLHDNEL